VVSEPDRDISRPVADTARANRAASPVTCSRLPGTAAALLVGTVRVDADRADDDVYRSLPPSLTN
jgi:hypothetical protein